MESGGIPKLLQLLMDTSTIEHTVKAVVNISFPDSSCPQVARRLYDHSIFFPLFLSRSLSLLTSLLICRLSPPFFHLFPSHFSLSRSISLSHDLSLSLLTSRHDISTRFRTTSHAFLSVAVHHAPGDNAYPLCTCWADAGWCLQSDGAPERGAAGMTPARWTGCSGRSSSGPPWSRCTMTSTSI